MAFKVFVLAAVLAVANAGYLGAPAALGYAAAPVVHAAPVGYAAPAVSYATPAVSYATPAVSYAAPAVSYAAAPVALAAPSIGSTHQSTLRSLDGNSAVSHYSKAVDSAFSSVRKYDTRVSNDAIAYAPAIHAAPVVHAAPAVHAYGVPSYAAAYHGAAVAAPIAAAYSAGPVVSHLSFNGLGASYGW